MSGRYLESFIFQIIPLEVQIDRMCKRTTGMSFFDLVHVIVHSLESRVY